MNNGNDEEISLFYIANRLFFALMIVIAFFWFGQSGKSGFIMLIYAAICSPFVTKKVIASGKLGKFSKLILFVIHFCLFLITITIGMSANSKKTETETIPEPQQQQQIIAEETTIETTEPPTEPTTEAEPETIPETTETPTEADTEPETEEITEAPKTEAETEAPTEPPTEPKKQVGKDIDTLNMFSYNGSVRNDVTGNWRYAVFADAGKNVAEYAVSYYDKYMSGSDTEIHAVINFSDMTTTKIVQAIAPDELALTVYSYVDSEEHDAKLMFGGNVLAYYTVNKETGEITEE